MVPTPFRYSSRNPRLLLTLASVVSQHVTDFRAHFPALLSFPRSNNASIIWHGTDLHTFPKRNEPETGAKFIVFACLIPILVLLSGVFAGLTLGYMSLDETQLNVLSMSGTPQQKLYANKIKPIRKDGHLLLVTLLLANMIVNETLPVISDPILGGGVQSVVVSTVLIVIFSEIIPQSLCTRYGLYFGAKMAGPVNVLLWTLGFVAWPVAKLLEIVLGPHHGIIYRRTELKELIAMHSSVGEYGGDLKTDTVTIIGGALDLQEKVVKQAMTPIADVFMLSIDAKLDYETLRQICKTGHSRVPVYEEVEVPVSSLIGQNMISDSVDGAITGHVGSVSNTGMSRPKTSKVKKIVGILLVKQCVLLDPKDATPIRKIPLNKVPFVPNNEPLLGILDRFQDGRSHMAIVSRFSEERAASVKKAVKKGLTQRLRDKVGMGDSSSSESETSDDEDGKDTKDKDRRSKSGMKKKKHAAGTKEDEGSDNEATLRGDPGSEIDDSCHHRHSPRGRVKKARFSVKRVKSRKRITDLEMGAMERDGEVDNNANLGGAGSSTGAGGGMLRMALAKPSQRLEQSMPADAVLAKQGVDELLQNVDPAVMPLGIITLEDVLEELIGEEIYDEFDPQGNPDLASYAQNETKPALKRDGSAPQLQEGTAANSTPSGAIGTGTKPLVSSSTIAMPLPTIALGGLMKNLGFVRSRSAPPMPREDEKATTEGANSADSEKDEVTFPDDDTYSVDVEPKRGDLGSWTPDVTQGDESSPPAVLSPAPTKPTAINVPSLLGIARANSRSRQAGRPSTPQIRAPIPVSISASVGASPNAGAATIALPLTASRSGSPAPSLEHAILVERKRRAAGGSPSSTLLKGARYKSSPLTGDRNGAVVAEKVKEEMEREIWFGEDGFTQERISEEGHKDASGKE